MNRTMFGTACAAGLLLLGCGASRPVAAPATPLPTPAGATVPGSAASGSADGYYTLGRSEHAAGHPAAARRAYGEALLREPDHGAARNALAVLLAEAGDYDGAVALWRTLVAQPSLPAIEQGFLLGNLGYALYLKGARDEAVTVLEKACLLDPLQPLAWEHLAAVLETLGQTERAVQMQQQARSLRTHDLRRDYALAGRTAPAGDSVDAEHSPWPADLARTEVRSVGAALVEVHRIAPGAAARVAVAPHTPQRDPVAPTTGAAALRLEISNGNGVRGMAATWARGDQVGGIGWKSVRLTNTRPFAVPVTRIEYGADGQVVARLLSQRLGLRAPQALAASGRADLRIVLGWDQRAAATRRQ